MKIKTNLKQFYGKQMNLPEVGKVELDKDGCVEIENEDVAKILIENSHFEEVTEEVIENEKKDPENEKKDPENEEKDNENESDDENKDPENENGESGNDDDDEELSDEELQNAIDAMELEQLNSLAKESKVKGYQLFSKDAEKLRDYLKKKLITE